MNPTRGKRGPQHNRLAGFSHREIFRAGASIQHLAQQATILSARDVGELMGLTHQMVHYHERIALGKLVISARRMFRSEVTYE